jgi:hypothetical protein
VLHKANSVYSLKFGHKLQLARYSTSLNMFSFAELHRRGRHRWFTLCDVFEDKQGLLKVVMFDHKDQVCYELDPSEINPDLGNAHVHISIWTLPCLDYSWKSNVPKRLESQRNKFWRCCIPSFVLSTR